MPRFPLCCVLILTLSTSTSPSRASEPVPPFVAGFDRFARHGELREEYAARLLLTELSCTACHLSTERDLTPKGGPDLSGVGNRLSLDWVKAFLTAPQTTKPGATMPDLFSDLPENTRRNQIEALTAFLSTQRQPFPELKAGGANPLPHEFWKKGDEQRGQRLYHQIGCVACHAPDPAYAGGAALPSALDTLLAQLDPEEIEAMGLSAAARTVNSIPLSVLKNKYTPQSLTFFLLNPEQTRPGGRMPNFQLEPVDAADLAAWLLRGEPTVNAAPPASLDAALVEQGRKLFRSLNCGNCHNVQQPEPRRPARPLTELNVAAQQSCLDAGAPPLPNYRLDQSQRETLTRYLTGKRVAETAPGKALELRLTQLNCHACHERDTHGGVGRERQRFFETVGQVDIGDEGRFPPSLSGVGKKLQPAWLLGVLQGKGAIRPHLTIRMPVFPVDQSAPLPRLFALVDQAQPPDGSRPPSEAQVFGPLTDLASAGRELLDAGCVQCHSMKGETLPGVVGVDLAGISARVQPDWFKSFLLNPGALKNRTRMPTFFPNGKSSNQEILRGDVDRQIAAIWAYLKEIETQPLPEKILAARNRQYVLTPTDRPILLRTFMEKVGPQAIAVGFPQGVHFAFDAENLRLALAWRGPFLDAYGSWFARSAPPASPLGQDVITLPPGPPLATVPADNDFALKSSWPATIPDDGNTRFRGYRFDKERVPTFLYRIAGYDVEDRIEPDGQRGLKRRLTITPASGTRSIWVRLHQDKELKRRDDQSRIDSSGLTVQLIAPHSQPARQFDFFESDSEWRVPVSSTKPTTLEIRYSW